MVAPSFQKYEIVSEPYESSGKIYIDVKHPTTGNIRKVRFYDEREYIKAYGALPEGIDKPKKWYGPQKDCLGFKDGFITIFKECPPMDNELFNESKATYTVWWGWSFSSAEEIPENIVSSYTPIKLFWEQVGDEEGYLFDNEKIEDVIDKIIYIQGRSEYVGETGERINIQVKVDSIDIEKNERYNSCSSIFVFSDDSGNIYEWKTSTEQTIKENDVIKLKGTVKEHKKNCGNKVTVLTRCKVEE